MKRLKQILFKGDSELLTEIKVWNSKFPFDLIWRKKYKIPFGSEQHRNMSLFDIKFDVEEEKYLKSIIKKQIKEDKERNNNQEKDKQLLKSKVVGKIKKKELDNIFDNLDLDQFNGIKV